MITNPFDKIVIPLAGSVVFVTVLSLGSWELSPGGVAPGIG